MKRVLNSISLGLLLITIGVVFFLINYGMLSWSFWLNIVDLWPLILILAGIGLLFSRKIPFSAVLLVFLLCILGYSFVVGDKPNSRYLNLPFSEISSQTVSINVPLSSEIEKAQVNLTMGGGEVQVQALDSEKSQSLLMTGDYQTRRNTDSTASDLVYNKSGDTITATFNSSIDGLNINDNNQRDVNLNLSTKVNYKFDISAGAIDGLIDFSNLKVDYLKISTGASKLDLKFGDTGIVTNGKIDCGAAKVTLIIPENVGVNIKLDGVAMNTNFMGSGLLLDGKNYKSQNYDSAKTKIDLDISTAAGSIQLERI